MLVEPKARQNRKPTKWSYLRGLKYCREQRGISLRQLSAISGVTTDTIWRLENLRRAARPETRKKIAKALRVPSREIVRRPTDKEIGIRDN
jgi:transcriptional regulator with XRE-family HTH domain